jgi:hypothetical protein
MASAVGKAADIPVRPITAVVVEISTRANRPRRTTLHLPITTARRTMTALALAVAAAVLLPLDGIINAAVVVEVAAALLRRPRTAIAPRIPMRTTTTMATTKLRPFLLLARCFT